jgi:hypothetical protein
VVTIFSKISESEFIKYNDMCTCKDDNGRRKMSVHYIAVINSVT